MYYVFSNKCQEQTIAIMAQRASSLWRHLPIYQIYGANTDVGKTIFTTVLCNALLKRNPTESVHYLKPVSTGPLASADDRHISRFAPGTETTTLFQFDDPVSPHIAARQLYSSPEEEQPRYVYPLADSTVLSRVQEHIASCAASGAGSLIVETAGGVNSPTPSASLQADLYRPLRLPICLVADHRLGGISATISAFESLHMRGYDVDAVITFLGSYQNGEYLREYFQKRNIFCLDLPPPPERKDSKDEDDDVKRLDHYYKSSLNNSHESGRSIPRLLDNLEERHLRRIENLQDMAGRAYKQIWYPFTQHQDLSEKKIMTIDSASGDFFQTTSPATSPQAAEAGVLNPTFDGSASWWTQGLGHGNPELALAAAYAAGRYGHVMFAGAVHEPALKLSSTLLEKLANPRLGKVFFSDNGSTGMEVAVKMALTASFDRYEWEKKKSEVGVLGLKGSYHGDTIGAMDASEPSTYNEKVHWYKGRGYWFDFPQVKMKNGRWLVESPKGMEDVFGEKTSFEALGDVFDLTRRLQTSAGQKYKAYIEQTLERLVIDEGRTVGALVMEPVILGAGGMLLVDPLFQHCLVEVVRSNSHIFSNPRGSADPVEAQDAKTWTGLPVVFDEVFTGLYRLGRFSSSTFLQVHPDISCHAKLLTGGLVPLCTTLASDSIYNAFLSSEKSDALLHGHSYTAHAVGCHVANTSLEMMESMHDKGDWDAYKGDWLNEAGNSQSASGEMGPWSAWSKAFVDQISRHQEVEGVIALGSVLAISLQDGEQAGKGGQFSLDLSNTNHRCRLQFICSGRAAEEIARRISRL